MPRSEGAAFSTTASRSRGASPDRGVLCVVLHDVAPSRWDACLRVMGRVHAVASQVGVPVRMTLLVVPQMHGEPATPDFVRWLQRLARAGHEVTLHGWRHLDEGPPPRGGWAWWHALIRRHYTAGEGEFSALDRTQAAERLAKGRAWLSRHELKAEGFVAPAWLMSPASWDAVEAAGFRYTCTLNQLVGLPGPDPLPTLPGPAVDGCTDSSMGSAADTGLGMGHGPLATAHGTLSSTTPAPLGALRRARARAAALARGGRKAAQPVPGLAASRRVLVSRSLVFSTRSAWRRVLSVAWNRGLAAWLRARHAPLLRLELHPPDADHAAVRHCWTQILREALLQRQPMTLAQAARRLL